MTCPDCEALRKRVEELELENSLLRFEYADLKRRLAFSRTPMLRPRSAVFQLGSIGFVGGLVFLAGLRVMLVGLGLGLSLTSLRLQR